MTQTNINMTEKEYGYFLTDIQEMIAHYVKAYNLEAYCQMQQKKSDDIQWVINLGDFFGVVRIILESWDSVRFGKDSINDCSILMRFFNYKNEGDVLSSPYGVFSKREGVFILNAKCKDSDELKKSFQEILDTCTDGLNKRTFEKDINAIVMN